MTMILKIDTSDNKKAVVELDGEPLVVKSGLGSAQNVLPAVAKILKKKKASWSDLKEIWVKTGPGSFTGLRVGVAIANALGYLLGIPVNGQKVGAEEIIEPEYE